MTASEHQNYGASTKEAVQRWHDQNHGGRMSDSQTTLEGLITEAIDRFPGHDFILKRHHRDGIWTVAFGNNIEAFVAIGYGKKPREALDAMVPVTPRALKRLKTRGHQPN